MIDPSQLALKTHTNFGCAAILATLDKLVATSVDRFPLQSHSCYEVCGTFNCVTNTNCDGTIIYNNPVLKKPTVEFERFCGKNRHYLYWTLKNKS
jgi:hypothetical protein